MVPIYRCVAETLPSVELLSRYVKPLLWLLQFETEDKNFTMSKEWIFRTVSEEPLHRVVARILSASRALLNSFSRHRPSSRSRVKSYVERPLATAELGRTDMAVSSNSVFCACP